MYAISYEKSCDILVYRAHCARDDLRYVVADADVTMHFVNPPPCDRAIQQALPDVSMRL